MDSRDIHGHTTRAGYFAPIAPYRLATVADAHRNGIKVVPESCPKLNQKDRIIEALGLLGEHLPSVDEETLSRYYKYLTARLSFPFTVYYPEPTITLEEVRPRLIMLTPKIGKSP